MAQLFRNHLVFVRRVLRRCGVQPGDLDDAVQETFLVVHRRIGDFEGRATERTWLYSVAMRVASTQRRTAMRESRRRERAGAQMHATRPVDPEHELSSSEAAEILDQLLDELDEDKRRVFVLAELEGMPVPEVAQILDLNVRTAHSRLRLARERFAAALARHHAREEGLARRLSLRALATRGRPGAPTPAQRRASWAALAVRLGGTPPVAASVPWWSALGGAVPFAATVVVGIGAVALAWRGTAPVANPRTEAVPEVAAGEQPAPALKATAQPEPTPPSVEVVVAEEPVRPTAATPAPPLRRGRRNAPAPAPAPAGAASETQPAPDALLEETQLLESARGRERQGEYAAAEALLDEHARRFPQGVLRDERLSTRVRVLCEQGRHAEASKVARTSALVAVVRAHCDAARTSAD